jgi:hypothetical protein
MPDPTPTPPPPVPLHRGIIMAYKMALESYMDTNNDFSDISKWAENLLPFATLQKQVTQDHMAQLEILNTLTSDYVGDGKTIDQDKLRGVGITDQYVLDLICPANKTVSVGDLGTVHSLYSAVAGEITTAGNAADQTFSNTTQGAMGVVTNGTSSMSTLASMLQSFVQTISSSTVKL